MTTTTATNLVRQNQMNDPGLLASQQFAQMLHAYKECSDEIQAVILDMVEVYNSSDATEDEPQAALATIAEALFPFHHKGKLGMCLEECENSDLTVKAVLKGMDKEEATFAERVETLLEERNMTQSDLASAIGVKQPAISMMLSRECRPQRRTVDKIAAALKVSPEAIWPGIKDDGI